MFSHCSVCSPKLSSQTRLSKAGFGLVELLVSISIIAIVAAIILVRQDNFNGAVLLRGQAYDIALAVRQVQLNAVASHNSINPNTNTSDFRSVLGVHFDVNDNDSYRIFNDASRNGFYDQGEEYGLQGILDPRFAIQAIRYGDATSGFTEVGEISVVYFRPNFDARFFTAAENEVLGPVVEIDVARRGVSGTGPGVLRTIEITATGQIAVK